MELAPESIFQKPDFIFAVHGLDDLLDEQNAEEVTNAGRFDFTIGMGRHWRYPGPVSFKSSCACSPERYQKSNNGRRLVNEIPAVIELMRFLHRFQIAGSVPARHMPD